MPSLHPTRPLSGSERHPVPGARVLHLTNANEWIEVTVRVRRKAPLPSADDLGKQLPKNRKILTREQFEKTYGADPADVAKVADFAKHHGLSVIRTDGAGLSVILGGTASAMSQAFGVKLMQYDSPAGKYRGRVGPILLPDELQGIVTGVFGLDNRRQARSHARIHPVPSGTSHATSTRPWFTPPELARAYGVPAGDGTGQCIGLLEFGGGFSDGDLDKYFQTLNLPRPTCVAVSAGADNTPGQDDNADGEVMLDIEVAGAVAPKAKLAVYFAEFTEKGWIDALTAAIHDTVNKPQVLSISWGFAEGNFIWTQQAIDHVNDILQAAAVLNVTICVASGDDGSSDDIEDGHAHVDFPAASQYVLAVGGTTLKAPGGTIQSEVVWNGGPRATAGGAGGGGISDSVDLPPWQRGLVPPSVNPGGRIGRGVPDVSANADGQTGYFVRSSGKSGVAGGTSAAAPLWAALIARINQALGTPVGYFNPLLYAQFGPGGVCRDITTGSNDTQGLVGGYAAGTGWDACTGWGSPNGEALLAVFRSPATPPAAGS
jgi:kumamolisin